MKTSAYTKSDNPLIILHNGKPVNTAAMAEAIYYLVYIGDDKRYRQDKTREIEDWLIDGSFTGQETAEYLAAEWQEYDNQADDQLEAAEYEETQ